MSKSLGNLVFVRELLADHAPATLRLLLAAHHYRSSWSYEASDLEIAEARRSAVDAVRDRQGRVSAVVAGALFSDFTARLDDDLDTPGALQVLDRAAASALAGADQAGAVEAAPILDRMLALLGAAPAA
jgi:L-cysteine:1D-myo-inositol 2-amino-2-deoxy-alpha-D-glucopyranoside ligase